MNRGSACGQPRLRFPQLKRGNLLRPYWPGLKNQVASLGVNGDARKAREKTIAKQACLTLENRLGVNARGDAVKSSGPQLNGGFGLWNRELGQSDGRLAHAVLRTDIRGDPLQGGGAACVQANPLGLSLINADLDTHSTWAKLKRGRIR